MMPLLASSCAAAARMKRNDASRQQPTGLQCDRTRQRAYSQLSDKYGSFIRFAVGGICNERTRTYCPHHYCLLFWVQLVSLRASLRAVLAYMGRCAPIPLLIILQV